MDIERFDDIPGLVFYINGAPGECTINKAGNDITSVVSGYGSQTITLTQQTATTNNITHDGTTAVGAVPCFIGIDSAVDAGLVGDFTTQIASGNLTIGVLEQRSTVANSYSVACTDSGGTSSLEGLRVASPNYSYRMRAVNIGLAPNIPATTGVHTVVSRRTTTADSLNVYVDSVEATATHGAQSSQDLFKVVIGNNATGGSHHRGNIAIVVIYNRLLDDTERDQLTTLLNYWRDNGEAPSTGPEPSTTFGPVSTNDDPSVTGWQWEESADGNSWANVGTILSDIAGATTQTLTVNSAPIEADQTRVRCKAFSANEPTGVVSHSAILTVQGGSPPEGPDIDETLFQNVTINEPESAHFRVDVQWEDVDVMDWETDISGSYRSMILDFPHASLMNMFWVSIPILKEGQNCNVRFKATNADGVSYSAPRTLTVGAKPPSPGAPNLLYQEHVTYLGSFDIPYGGLGSGQDTKYSGNALTIADNGAALYIGCRQGSGASKRGYGKISIPAVGGSATWLINSVEFQYDRTFGYGYDSGSDYIRGGLVYGDKIVLTPAIWYDSNPSQGYTAQTVSLDLQTWSPMYTADYASHLSVIKGKTFLNGYMCHVPAGQWQTDLGWPVLAGNGVMSVAADCSCGHSMIGINPDDMGETNPYPIEVFCAHQLSTPLQPYDCVDFKGDVPGAIDIPTPGNPAVCPNDVWNAGNDTAGMFWPEGTDSILVLEMHGVGQSTYKLDIACSDGGRKSEPYRAQIAAYDAKDLLRVKNSEIQPHEVVPYAVWPLPDEIQSRCPGMQPGALAYDPALRRVYFLDEKEMEDSPRVHVLQVGTLA